MTEQHFDSTLIIFIFGFLIFALVSIGWALHLDGLEDDCMLEKPPSNIGNLTYRNNYVSFQGECCMMINKHDKYCIKL